MSDSPHPTLQSREHLLKDCEVTRQRRSGPGGQHRNKVETAIRLQHRPSGVTAEASERRSQAANLSTALQRLRLNLALEVRQHDRQQPSELWSQRCHRGKIVINPEHDDFPALLAEALDFLAAANWNTTDAARTLNCSTTQLVKLLRKEPRSLRKLNDHRCESGLSPLR